MTKAITLEFHGEDLTRALIIERDDSNGAMMIADIFEADEPNLDSMWSLIADKHSDLTHVRLNDGTWEDADCLTVREAAEANFVREA